MTNRSLRIDRASPRQLLARILDEPSLVATIRSLAPRTLGKLIDRIGLEDSGELVSLATTEQLAQIFDDDLWKSERPGGDEAFDADRFALWLEVMLDAGEDFVAQKLLELPEDMVTLALHRHLLVLDTDQRRAEMEDREDGTRVDKALEGYMYEEFDEYLVLSRRHGGWDAIVTVLTALDERDHPFLGRLLERCCHLSSEYIDGNGGLYDVLTSDEMVESDLAAEREDRRAAEGFIAPSHAASFLALCRSARPEEVVAGPRDAVTRAYFRELSSARTPHRSDSPRPLPAAGGPADRTADLERMLAELGDEDLPRGRRPVFLMEGLMEEKSGAAGANAAIFKNALAALHEREPGAHAHRIEEIAYLTNVLVSGCAVAGRNFRPFEAIVAVAAVSNLGLEHLVKTANGASTTSERAFDWLRREGAEKAFRVGWWLLHHEVAIATCDALAVAFTARARRTTDLEGRRADERSAKFVAEKRAQGRPALARNRLAELAVDEATRAVLEGLLSDCPLLSGPLVRDGANRYPLEPGWQFVASEADLKRVRAFLAALGASEPRD